MQAMKGYRTIIVGWVGAVLSPWIAQHLGVTLTENEKLYLVGAIMGAITHVMRLVTSTPFGRPRTLTQEQIKQVIDIIRREVPRLTKTDPSNQEQA